MSPGTYIRLRREHADWTIDKLALHLGATPAERAAIRNELTMLEDDRPGDYGQLVFRLRDVFPFDLQVWLALLGHAQAPGSDLPCPRICTVCACSWNDPCVDEDGQPCAWRSSPDPESPIDICTACPAPDDPEPASQPAPATAAEIRDAA